MDTDDKNGVDLSSGRGPKRTELRDLLSDPHVRYLLQYLRREPGPADLVTAAKHVAAGVTDTPPDEVPSDVKERVQTFLHHGHVPELAAHGIVEYDRESNTVTLTQ